MTKTINTDFLILGSGIAGLTYALEVAKKGKVIIVTKKNKAESNTNYAQGGIASVISKDDNFDLHYKDTLNAGAGLCHKDAVKILVTNGPDRVNELMEIGADFTHQDGTLHLGREGGHTMNRIVHSRDFTGKEVERALLQRVAENQNITLFEDHIAIDLITEHNLLTKPPLRLQLKQVPRLAEGLLGKQDDIKSSEINCWGAYILDSSGLFVKKILAKITMLATGGLGQVYLHTSNPKIATGDGIAMALRAGAKMASMEFIQFHPTTLYTPSAESFLISEAVRGYGGILKKKNGETFMEKYSEMGCLAPRDIVARAIDTELKKSGDEYVYLDVTHKEPDTTKEHFPSIYKKCLSFGIDMTKEYIPVVPAAHYSCGGVMVDLMGKTCIRGLYACGEVSMTGVHGANRLASNSLLEALVFSKLAAFEVVKNIDTISDIPEIQDWDDSGTFDNEEWVLISHNRKEIQSIMSDYVGIVRSNLRLERAKRRIDLIRKEVEEFYKKTKVTYEIIELRNLCVIAELIIFSALQRKESRGLHFTTDYPQKDDKNWLKDVVVYCSNDDPVVEFINIS